ncbi:MAG: bifunctional 23S rRNA (guanine(2069)-N(7))-methyltransferase RlmK/23S rRNA (guanine(2445)-N(2))-methyltransferase RlmL, partial [Parahaliea sp.]
DSLRYLYRELGEAMKREFGDWQAAVFTSDLELGRAIGLRSHRQYRLYNGAIPSSLLLFELAGNRLREESAASTPSSRPAEAAPVAPAELGEGAAMFANRLRKNRRRLAPWLRREGIECYRLYDADMPEYAVAVDIYGARVHVAEYQAPRGVDPQAAARRLEEVMQALPQALDLSGGEIACKVRQRQRGGDQYARQDARGELLSVREGQARLLVNLHDYLDTGLFLDHRPLRRRIAAEARGRDFLNLFCYTGAASVHAALGGARSTTSVDLSNTYLGWLRKNLAHNGLGEAHNTVVRADCLAWLDQPGAEFDLIMLDPPSFSNSKAMQDSFDVQRDHPALVRAAMARLRPGGQLYFSNNRRGFKLDLSLAEAFDCQDITAQTLDPDFARNARIHVCHALRHRVGR